MRIATAGGVAIVRGMTTDTPGTGDQIEPDTKDWTWVLERPCPDCGLAAGAVDGAEVPALLRAYGLRFAGVLRRPDVAARPARGVWSPLEYACHVRDASRLFAERARLMLAEDVPGFPNWDQDAAAIADRYDLQDPATVARELAEAVEEAAGVFASVSGDQWDRRGLRSNGSSFSVRTLAQYFVHDVAHHAHDVHA